MEANYRKNIRNGLRVKILEKENKLSGELTAGLVNLIITTAPSCPTGIKVKLASGQIGRVKEILSIEK